MNSNLKILVLEDDFINRRLVKKVLVNFGHTIAADFDNVEDAKLYLQKNIVDLAILDINLGKNNATGISFGQHLKDSFQIPFIYLTAYGTTDIIKSAVETNPASFLTKPFSTPDMIAAIELAISNHKKEVDPCEILIKEKGVYFTIQTNEIKYLESKGNYISIYTDKREYTTRSTIKEILKKLPNKCFFQVHRAFITNKNHISSFTSDTAIIGETNIPMAKKYFENLQKGL